MTAESQSSPKAFWVRTRFLHVFFFCLFVAFLRSHGSFRNLCFNKTLEIFAKKGNGKNTVHRQHSFSFLRYVGMEDKTHWTGLIWQFRFGAGQSLSSSARTMKSSAPQLVPWKKSFNKNDHRCNENHHGGSWLVGLGSEKLSFFEWWSDDGTVIGMIGWSFQDFFCWEVGLFQNPTGYGVLCKNWMLSMCTPVYPE